MAVPGCEGAGEILFLPPWPQALLILGKWGSTARKKERVGVGGR